MSNAELVSEICEAIEVMFAARPLITPARFDEPSAALYVGLSPRTLQKLRQRDRERLSQDPQAEMRGPKWYYEPGLKRPWYTRAALDEWLGQRAETGSLEPTL